MIVIKFKKFILFLIKMLNNEINFIEKVALILIFSDIKTLLHQ